MTSIGISAEDFARTSVFVATSAQVEGSLRRYWWKTRVAEPAATARRDSRPETLDGN